MLKIPSALSGPLLYRYIYIYIYPRCFAIPRHRAESFYLFISVIGSLKPCFGTVICVREGCQNRRNWKGWGKGKVKGNTDAAGQSKGKGKGGAEAPWLYGRNKAEG